MIGFLYHWFDWPSGSVLTNLIASAVCVAFAGWRIVKRFNRRFDRLHSHLDLVHGHIKLVHEHQLAHTPKPRQTRKA